MNPLPAPVGGDRPARPRLALQIGRVDVDTEFKRWYNTTCVPNYEKVPRVIRRVKTVEM
jgi:hypothetical protein